MSVTIGGSPERLFMSQVGIQRNLVEGRGPEA